MQQQSMESIREHKRRLRERYKKHSLEGFHSSEVLELLLSYASPRKDVKVLSDRLLDRFRGIRGVFDASADELASVEGITENTAVLLKLMKDMAGEYLKERMKGKDVIACPEDVLDYLNLTLSGEKVEKFMAIYLNPRNEILGVEILHEGTINQTVVYPRKAIELAFRHNASSVIFIHNHPSGDATPSNVDRQLAKVLDRAALAVDLLVHDHLIVGRDSHFSTRESGWFAGYPTHFTRPFAP